MHKKYVQCITNNAQYVHQGCDELYRSEMITIDRFELNSWMFNTIIHINNPYGNDGRDGSHSPTPSCPACWRPQPSGPLIPVSRCPDLTTILWNLDTLLWQYQSINDNFYRPGRVSTSGILIRTENNKIMYRQDKFIKYKKSKITKQNTFFTF